MGLYTAGLLLAIVAATGYSLARFATLSLKEGIATHNSLAPAVGVVIFACAAVTSILSGYSPIAGSPTDSLVALLIVCAAWLHTGMDRDRLAANKQPRQSEAR